MGTVHRLTQTGQLTKADARCLVGLLETGDDIDPDEVLLEELVPAEPGGRYPICLDGARACPPENCGGTPGYQQLIDTLADPTTPDHHYLLQWLGIEKGADFDPARFDPADSNRRLDTVVLAANRTA